MKIGFGTHDRIEKDHIEIQCHCHYCDARYGPCPLTPCLQQRR